MMIEPRPAMETTFQALRAAQGWDRKNLSISFADSAHLMDSLVLMHSKGQVNEFMGTIGRLLLLFVGDAAGRGEFAGGPDGYEPPVPGEVVQITLRPQSQVRPSFYWKAEKILDIAGSAPVFVNSGCVTYYDQNGWRITFDGMEKFRHE